MEVIFFARLFLSLDLLEENVDPVQSRGAMVNYAPVTCLVNISMARTGMHGRIVVATLRAAVQRQHTVILNDVVYYLKYHSLLADQASPQHKNMVNADYLV